MSGTSERPEDFRSVYARTRGMVYALTLQMLGDRAEAEDSVQTTFLQVHRFLGRFRGESSVATWVCRIALREAALRARQRAERRYRAASEVERVRALRGEGAGVGVGDGDEVLVAMQRLSEDHRAVLSLLHLREIPVRQAAEILGLPEGTVWSRAHAARRELRAIMRSGEAGGGAGGGGGGGASGGLRASAARV